MAKFREYCCCAIPLANAGIYLIILTQLLTGFTAGILSVATTPIVGAATPSVAPWIFAIISWVAAVVQVLGILGILRTSTILFRRYVSLHSLATVAVFSVGAVWTIISATRHSAAKVSCISTFFNKDNSTEQDEAQTMCEIFPWVDVGVMGGLWALLAIVFGYFYVVILSYNSSLQHGELYSTLDTTKPVNHDDIPMNTREPWDSQPSANANRQLGHYRDESATSMSDVMSEPVQQPRDGLSDTGSHYTYRNAYPPVRQGSDSGAPALPSSAFAGPTPKFTDGYYGGQQANLSRPANVQSHPAEGSFHRKTPGPSQDFAYRGYSGY